jgi:hypothetical protein
LACATVTVDSIAVSRVIKVTPTLVYLDVAAESGIVIGDRFIIGRAGTEENAFARVAKVQVLRLFEKFLIAEIESDSYGGSIRLLDMAVRLEEWDNMRQKPKAMLASAADSLATISPGSGFVLSKLRRFCRGLFGGNQPEDDDSSLVERAILQAPADAVIDTLAQRPPARMATDENQEPADSLATITAVHHPEDDDSSLVEPAILQAPADAVIDTVAQHPFARIAIDENQEPKDSLATISPGSGFVLSKLRRFARGLFGGNHPGDDDSSLVEPAILQAPADAVIDTVAQRPSARIAIDENQEPADSLATITAVHHPLIFQRLGWALLGGYKYYKGGDVRPKLRGLETTAGGVGDRFVGLGISWRIYQSILMVVTYETADTPLEDEVFGRIRSQHRSVNGAVQYFFGANIATRPYVSVGLGVHDRSFRGPLLVTGNSRRLGVDLGAGFEHPVGRGWKILGETSYRHVRRGNDPATSNNYRLSIGIGYRASM